MKKNNLNNKSIVNVFRAFSMFAVVLMIVGSAFGQTTIVNYDFNTGTSYPTLTPIVEPGVTAIASSTQTFSTVGGIATGAGAFTVNATAGTAITMTDSSGTNTKYYQFDIGGVSTFAKYKIYFQGQRSNTGAQTATIAYSSTGCAGAFTNFATTMTVATGFATSTPTLFDLTSISALDNQANVCFRVLASGASGTGTFRIDNFQVSANGPLDITTANALPNALEMTAYTTPLVSAGGVAPYTYAVTAGTLPAGLTLNTNGTWAGMPSMGTAGVYGFDVTVTDSNPFSFSKGLSSFAPNTKTETFSLRVAAPTAANATITGRLNSAFGRGLANANVSITNAATGEIKRTRSNQRGYFNFLDMEVGNLYIIEVQSKRFVFNNYSFTLNEDLTDLVLTAQ
jgi:Putative Ig domain/Carboxypeptidase regulatory-like domain